MSNYLTPIFTIFLIFSPNHLTNTKVLTPTGIQLLNHSIYMITTMAAH